MERTITRRCPLDLVVYLLFQLLYNRTLRSIHKFQNLLRVKLKLEDEKAYDSSGAGGWTWSLSIPFVIVRSVPGFLEPRVGLLCKVMGILYVIKFVITVLAKCGWRVKEDLSWLVNGIGYTLYAGADIASSACG
jgi:hypothetical protein